MRLFVIAVLLSIFAGPQLTFAQVASDTFNIRVYGGTDTTPPSTPTLLSATPVATTQIDLAWSSSTDNFVVAGYVVYRDLVPVATTSLTSYSDTGLIASTTYDYMVQAFDTSLNYSSTSNELSATTLEPPPPPPTPVIPEPPEATIARVVVDELMVVPGVSTTSIELVTARPARIELRWGRTASYELGYVVGGAYTVDHAILLTDLEPGTTYEYEIIGFTPYGSQSVLRTGSFTTLWHFPIDPPANVNRFSALAVGDDVRLSWVMPETKNLSYVRVVRSHLGFPLHPQDGAIVYQGLQEAFVDEFILSQYSPVYYTAFMYDVQGNVSSGAVAYVYAVGGAGYAGAVPGGSGASLLVQEATTSIMQERVTVDMHMPDASEIAITQGVRVFTMADDDMLLHSQSPFTITIPVATVAGNLKSIIATITDPTDHRQTYAYLLRINHDRTAYEAIVTPLNVVGESQIKVEIYDYEAFVVARYQAPLTFAFIPDHEPVSVLFPDTLIAKPYLLVVPLAITTAFLGWLGWLLFFRRRTEDKG